MLIPNILYYPQEVPPRAIEWRKYFLIVVLTIFCKLLLQFLASHFLGLIDYDLKREITLDEATSLKFILSICVFAPIVEELIFRLPLVVNRVNLIVSSGLLIYCLYSKYNLGGAYEPSLMNLLALAVSLLIPSLLLSADRSAGSVINFIKDQYSLFFYGLVILFGVLHILRYGDVPYYIYILSPVIMLPHIFMGYGASYFRLRYGLGYSILFHAIVNCLPMLFLLGYKFWLS